MGAPVTWKGKKGIPRVKELPFEDLWKKPELATDSGEVALTEREASRQVALANGLRVVADGIRAARSAVVASWAPE
eukprot:14399092-Alexandrium_andersonii.AAC.1